MSKSKLFTPKLTSTWPKQLSGEFKKSYFISLKHYLNTQYQEGKTIYPAVNDIFKAFEFTPFEDVKVVILGQDPYHGSGQAEGLSFSVPQGLGVPPSLKNIYKELSRDLSIPVCKQGSLKDWAKQGVLLLNAVLTVEQGMPNSHQGRGWEQFTDKVIQTISDRRSGVVFFLWGAYAQKKSVLIEGDKHCVLKSTHPSPFSAYRGFLGCGHFSQANRYLKQQGHTEINWQLDEVQKELGF